MQACAELLLCLPSADALAQPGPDGDTPLWEADAVLASRVQFLLSMLGPCMPRLAQVRGHVPRHMPLSLMRRALDPACLCPLTYAPGCVWERRRACLALMHC